MQVISDLSHTCSHRCPEAVLAPCSSFPSSVGEGGEDVRAGTRTSPRGVFCSRSTAGSRPHKNLQSTVCSCCTRTQSHPRPCGHKTVLITNIEEITQQQMETLNSQTELQLEMNNQEKKINSPHYLRCGDLVKLCHRYYAKNMFRKFRSPLLLGRWCTLAVSAAKTAKVRTPSRGDPPPVQGV